MADTGLADLFTVQFIPLLKMNLQQKPSLLRRLVSEQTFTGAKMASPLNLVQAMSLKTPEGRFAPKANTPAVYQRRWVLPNDKELDVLIDNFDLLKTPIDPKSTLIQTVGSAVNRAWDDEIIASAVRDAVIGVDMGSLSTEQFNTTNFRVADDFGASAAVGLTVAKLIEAKRILRHYHNGDELDANQSFLIIGSKQEADFLNQAQVTSSDFNRNGGVLTDGKVTRFMGFDIVVSERLPTYTTNTRGVLVGVKSGLCLGLWQDMKIQVVQRFDLSSNPWDISCTTSFGATRTEAGKIVQIACLDATGADITP